MIISRNTDNFIPLFWGSMYALLKLCLTALTARFPVFNDFLTQQIILVEQFLSGDNTTISV